MIFISNIKNKSKLDILRDKVIKMFKDNSNKDQVKRDKCINFVSKHAKIFDIIDKDEFNNNILSIIVQYSNENDVIRYFEDIKRNIGSKYKYLLVNKNILQETLLFSLKRRDTEISKNLVNFLITEYENENLSRYITEKNIENNYFIDNLKLKDNIQLTKIQPYIVEMNIKRWKL